MRFQSFNSQIIAPQHRTINNFTRLMLLLAPFRSAPAYGQGQWLPDLYAHVEGPQYD